MVQFSNSVFPFLKGEKFSNGLEIKVAKEPSVSKLPRRLDLLEDIAKNKGVIHVGFADHLPLIKNKIEKGTWLHKRLVDSATVCWGIDIDKELVDYVRNEIGIKEVLQCDIVNDDVPNELKGYKWDYMIIGEVLEHIDNPVLFVRSIREKYAGIVGKVIMTVPNAHELLNIRNIFRGVECINTDHRFWFTPYTLAKVGTSAGLTVESFTYCQTYMPKNRLSRILVRKFPMLRESLLMIFQL
jgi:hypothetical protein